MHFLFTCMYNYPATCCLVNQPSIWSLRLFSYSTRFNFYQQYFGRNSRNYISVSIPINITGKLCHWVTWCRAVIMESKYHNAEGKCRILAYRGDAELMCKAQRWHYMVWESLHFPSIDWNFKAFAEFNFVKFYDSYICSKWKHTAYSMTFEGNHPAFGVDSI